MLKQLLALVLTFSTLKLCYSATLEEVEAVYSSIFTNYSKDLRPVTDQSTVLTIKIKYHLIAINSFDEVAGIISIPSMFTLEWTDPRLTWDTETNGYLYLLTIPQTQLWLPKIYLTAPAKYYKAIGDDEYLLKVLYNGYIYWSTGTVLQSTCSPDTTYFPFDQQNCKLTVAVWGYGSNEVILSATSAVDFTYFQPNGEWEVINATGSDITTTGDSGVSFAQFDILLKRRPVYFLISILLPVVFLAFLNPLVFILPIDSGERMSFCLTVLLSFAVFMTLIDDVMPKSSEPAMALVSYYILGSIIFSTLITIVNVFILAAYHKPDGDDVPRFLQCLVRTCCCKSKRNAINPEMSTDKVSNFRITNGKLNANDNEIDNSKTVHSKDITDKTVISWKMVAACIDRILVIGFYVVTIASSIGFLIRLTSG